MEPLLRALFCADAAPLDDRIASSSGFASRFSAQGPRDRQGRSLRELDLKRRLFRYPLSYLIYSEHFDALPDSHTHRIWSRRNKVVKAWVVRAGRDGEFADLAVSSSAALSLAS